MLPLHAAPGDQIEPFTAGSLLTAWTFEPVLLAVILSSAPSICTACTAFARGETSGRASRTFSFVGLGLGSAVIATQSGIGTYDTVLLSVHMAQHMILSMLTPLAMALGAPVTLALRTFRSGPAAGCSPCCTRASPR